jgi:hypothetical protein
LVGLLQLLEAFLRIIFAAALVPIGVPLFGKR